MFVLGGSPSTPQISTSSSMSSGLLPSARALVALVAFLYVLQLLCAALMGTLADREKEDDGEEDGEKRVNSLVGTCPTDSRTQLKTYLN